MKETEFLGIKDKKLINIFKKLVKELLYLEFFWKHEDRIMLESYELDKPREEIHIVEFIYLAQGLELDEEIIAKITNWHDRFSKKGILFISVDPHEPDIFKATSFNLSKKYNRE